MNCFFCKKIKKRICLWYNFCIKYRKEVAENVTVQYGGSMNDGNAADLIAQTDIDGGLVGGASLIPEKFAVIIKAGDAAAK